MAENLAIEVRGLRKSYGTVQALHGVDLEVERGEIFGFLGPNGAGKTTTIRCLLDLVRPQAGTMRILGLDVRADPVAVRAQVGYLPGELALEANLRVRDILRYFADLRGNRVDWAFAEGVARRLELDLAMQVKNLSKGNKQKVGLVQALMARPDLLLLDEPTSGLDPLMQQEVYRLLREAQAAGATVFMSSHLFAELMLFAMLALLASLLLPASAMGAMLAGALLAGSFLVLGLAGLNTQLEPFIRYTPLYYYQGGNAVSGLNWGWFAGLIAIALALAVGAWALFRIRDIRVSGEHDWRLPGRRRRSAVTAASG